MEKMFSKTVVIIVFLWLLTGCALGPHAPPLFGPNIGAWMGWVIAGLVIIGVWILLRRTDLSHSSQKEYLTNALNDLNERLKILEDKIDKLGGKK